MRTFWPSWPKASLGLVRTNFHISCDFSQIWKTYLNFRHFPQCAACRDVFLQLRHHHLFVPVFLSPGGKGDGSPSGGYAAWASQGVMLGGTKILNLVFPDWPNFFLYELVKWLFGKGAKKNWLSVVLCHRIFYLAWSACLAEFCKKGAVLFLLLETAKHLCWKEHIVMSVCVLNHHRKSKHSESRQSSRQNCF